MRFHSVHNTQITFFTRKKIISNIIHLTVWRTRKYFFSLRNSSKTKAVRSRRLQCLLQHLCEQCQQTLLSKDTIKFSFKSLETILRNPHSFPFVCKQTRNIFFTSRHLTSHLSSTVNNARCPACAQRICDVIATALAVSTHSVSHIRWKKTCFMNGCFYLYLIVTFFCLRVT